MEGGRAGMSWGMFMSQCAEASGCFCVHECVCECVLLIQVASGQLWKCLFCLCSWALIRARWCQLI